MKKLLFLNYFTILILFLLIFAAISNTYQLHLLYGLEYTTLTIIEGNEVIRVVRIWDNIISILVMLGMLITVILDTRQLRELNKTKQETST